MRKLHQKLQTKFNFYHNWHQHRHHNKVHWGVLLVSSLFVLSLILNPLELNFSNNNQSFDNIQIKQARAVNPIDNLKPGEWYEVPGSKLNQSGVFPPSPAPLGYPPYIIDAWSGGAYDTQRDKFMIWGGGHGDYSGNEIYAFDINTLKWSRLWGPSPNIPVAGGVCNETYSDGNPASRHTYDGLVYLPTQDKLFSAGGSLWCGSGGGSKGAWTYDMVSSSWLQKATPLWTAGVSMNSDYYSVTGGVISENSEHGSIDEYNPSTNVWTRRKVLGGVALGTEMSAAIDPINRIFVVVGNGKIHALNLDTNTLIQPTSTGGSAVINTRGPGLVYDPILKKIVGWPGGNSNGIRDTQGDTSVYSLDINTWTWTNHAVASTNVVIPTGATRVGVFGRFQYVPSKNVYMLVNATNESVYIYKLSSGDAPPSPDVISPTVSVTTPVPGSTVSGSSVTVSATASDNVGVAGVQFKLDGVNLGAEDTISPYSISWDTTKATNGSHTLTAVARDIAGNTGTAASVPVTVSNAPQPPPPSGQIDIPLNTWVARPMPKIGQGPSGGIKHIRLAHNPVNGRIYIEGGDYAGPIGFDSGRNETYSYSIFDNAWKLEFPYCGPAGSVQPGHPDQVGWVYDTKRNIFWMLPGYMGAGVGDCPESNLIPWKIMTFDPTTGKWSLTTRNTNITGEATGFAQYDPVTDTIVRFVGISSLVYDITTDTWTTITYTTDLNGVPIMSNADWGRGYTALDLANRYIYIISPFESRLYRYDMDTRKVIYLINTPVPTPTPDNIADRMMPIWDSVNKVLLWPQIFDNSGKGMKLHVYHPDTNTWEANIPLNQPEGLEVRGNSAVFDPYQNVLLLMGGAGGQPANPYLFVYRYGNGSGTPPPPPKPSDLNQDGKVDQQDLDILKQNWNRTDKPKSDINQDGIVDSRDLGILMSNWTG